MVPAEVGQAAAPNQVGLVVAAFPAGEAPDVAVLDYLQVGERGFRRGGSLKTTPPGEQFGGVGVLPMLAYTSAPSLGVVDVLIVPHECVRTVKDS